MFNKRAQDWPDKIEVAYPRFEDIYKEAGLSGFPEIPDASGETFKKTLDIALAAKPAMVQVATWNDWGEGTQIEPSQEFGYRDLETLQTYRRKLDPQFAFTADDLKLPYKLYELRRKYRGDSGGQSKLNRAAEDLFAGKTRRAEEILSEP
jgi:hypothetical protein